MAEASFHFLRPWWLLALVPLLWVLWRLLTRPLGWSRWEGLVDPALMPYVLDGARTGRQRLPVLLTVAGVVAVVALAGPAWRKLPQTVYRGTDALVIVLDLSQSMASTDLEPSRAERARFKVSDILDRRPDGQTGLVVFADDAFVVTPLTDDVATIRAQLMALTPDIMPVQGSRPDRALELAGELLASAGVTRGSVLLIADAVRPERDGRVARSLAERGFPVSVMGVGTDQGAPVPLARGGYLTDGGRIVVPGLESQDLEAVARAGNGRYARLRPGAQDVDRLLQPPDGAGVDGEATDLTSSDVWREEGPWLLAVLLPFAALAFRRGALVLLVAAVPLGLGYGPVAQAAGWSDLWLRPDQQGARALEDGDAAAAAELFEDQDWRAAAAYRADQFEQAAEALEGADTPDAHYNRGNALARLGRYPEAIEAYEQGLALDPGNEDAVYNRDLLKEQMAEQQQQSSGGGQQGDGEDSESGQGQSGQQGEPQAGDGEQSAGQQDGDDPMGSRDEAGRDGEQEGETGPGAEGGPGNETEGLAGMDGPDEAQQATEQWLRRIPDDPGGLLRRKFLYQHRQRGRTAEPEAERW